jgi:hypothetical protein
MVVSIIIVILVAIIAGLSKAVADIVEHRDNWVKSIFAAYKPSSFWGPKDITWFRKYRSLLTVTIFVFTTDIWHFANFIRHSFTYVALVTFFILGGSFCIFHGLIFLTIYITLFLTAFNIFYHKILRK